MWLLRPWSRAPAEPVLRGLRVYLRPPVEADWRAWVELRTSSREFLVPWEPTWARDALTRSAFRQRLRRNAAEARNDQAHTFFIFRHGDDALLGGVSLSNLRRGVAQAGTLGYWIGRPHARQGYMTDALRCMIEFAVSTLGLHRLEAACIPSNEASRRLLLRCGFEQEGRARQYLKINGEWHDHLLFAIVLGEPLAATAPAPHLRAQRRV